MDAKNQLLMSLITYLNSEDKRHNNPKRIVITKIRFFSEFENHLKNDNFKLPKKYKTLEEYIFSKPLRNDIKAVVSSIFPDKLMFLILTAKYFDLNKEGFKGINPIYSYIFELNETDYELMCKFKFSSYYEYVPLMKGEIHNEHIIFNEVPYVDNDYSKPVENIILLYNEQDTYYLSEIIDRLITEYQTYYKINFNEATKYVYNATIKGINYITYFITPRTSFDRAFRKNFEIVDILNKRLDDIKSNKEDLFYYKSCIVKLKTKMVEESKELNLNFIDAVINKSIIDFCENQLVRL